MYIGGDGVDEIELTSASCDVTFTNCAARDLTITLDDQANDGAAGEGDDVRSDIEDVDVFGQSLGFATFQGSVNLTASEAFSDLSTGGGNDTVDPRGGSDLVETGAGDDTVNARDGFSDRIDCREGVDTANVDQLDVVVGCETVNAEQVAVALEDRAPGLAFDVAAALDPSVPTLLRASPTDDRGIQRVLFMDDERTVCNDDAAPYECLYQPRGEDVGRNTLIGVAIDTANQAAFVAREVTVSKFRATRPLDQLPGAAGDGDARPARGAEQHARVPGHGDDPRQAQGPDHRHAEGEAVAHVPVPPADPLPPRRDDQGELRRQPLRPRAELAVAHALVADERERADERADAAEDHHAERDAQRDDAAADGDQAGDAHRDPAEAVQPAQQQRLAVGQRADEQRGVDPRVGERGVLEGAEGGHASSVAMRRSGSSASAGQSAGSAGHHAYSSCSWSGVDLGARRQPGLARRT